MIHGAIIGIGKIAQTAHLPAYEDDRISGRARIVAAVDPSEESRRIAGERYPALRYYETAGEMFEKEQIDFIDICATPRYHGELVREAVRRHKHILCEKPFAESLPEARRLKRLLSGEQSLVFMPCHQYVYSPLWGQLKSFLCGHQSEDRWLLQFNVFRTGADPGLHTGGSAWRVDRSLSGGGILADTGVHFLYLSSWMLGNPLAVTARGTQLVHAGEPVEDTATLLLESAKGDTQITMTWGADRRANSALLLGRQGSMVYDGTTLKEFSEAGTRTHAVPDASDKSHYVSLYVSLIDEFVGAILAGGEHGQWIEDAYRSIRLLDACYRSADEGKTIRIGATS